jgi:hypothetical protein
MVRTTSFFGMQKALVRLGLHPPRSSGADLRASFLTYVALSVPPANISPPDPHGLDARPAAASPRWPSLFQWPISIAFRLSNSAKFQACKNRRIHALSCTLVHKLLGHVNAEPGRQQEDRCPQVVTVPLGCRSPALVLAFGGQRCYRELRCLLVKAREHRRLSL